MIKYFVKSLKNKFDEFFCEYCPTWGSGWYCEKHKEYAPSEEDIDHIKEMANYWKNAMTQESDFWGCPKCGVEYLNNAIICKDCDEKLVFNKLIINENGRKIFQIE